MPKRTLLRAALVAFGTIAASWAQAEDTGSSAEAKALLDRAVVEVKADIPAALAKFNDAKGSFRDRDLYVFCANASDGILTAHPKLVGTDLKTIVDKNGKALGKEMLDNAKEGEITEVTYVWPRPNATDPEEKISFVTKVNGQVCGAGYYTR